MILYNITFNIEPEIKGQWLTFMKSVYIPFALESDLFFDAKVFRLLNETENQGLTYSIQFFTDSLDKVNFYLEKLAPEIVEKHNEFFMYKHVSFMTILEHVEL